MTTVIVYLPEGYRHAHFTLTVIEKSSPDLQLLAAATDELQTAKEGLQESIEAQLSQPS